MYDGKMTLDNLAACMRGHDRQSLVMIQTDQGLKHIRLITGTHGSKDGVALPAGATAGGDSRYIIVLHMTDP